MPEEVKSSSRRGQLTELWVAYRPGGKSLWVLKSDDGRIIIAVKHNEVREFFQLSEGDAASLAFCLLREVMWPDRLRR